MLLIADKAFHYSAWPDENTLLVDEARRMMSLAVWKSVFFILTLNVIYGWCYKVTGNTGYFVSDGYPSGYPPNMEELYVAHLVTPGPQQVRLDYIVDLKPSNSKCRKDSVYLPDLSIRLCGQTEGTIYLSIEGEEFNLTFTSDSQGSGSGFNITFTVLEGKCRTTLRLGTDEDRQLVLVPITDMLVRDSVVFSARSCHVVKMHLTSHSQKKSWIVWRKVYIGSNSTTSRLMTCRQVNDHCSVKETFTHPQPALDCCQFRSYWIKWTDMSVEVGEGRVVGAEKFMAHTWSSKREIPVRFIYVQVTKDPKDVIFEAPLPDAYCELQPPLAPLSDDCETAEVISVTSAMTITPQDECHPVVSLSENSDYELQPIMDMDTRTSLKMACKACDRGLLIALAVSGILDHHDTLLFVKDTKTVIFRNCQTFGGNCDKVKEVHAPLFNCSSFVDIWVSWSPVNISVGRGDVINSDVIASYRESTHVINDVNFIFMTTNGNAKPITECVLDAPFPPEYCSPDAATENITPAAHSVSTAAEDDTTAQDGENPIGKFLNTSPTLKTTANSEATAPERVETTEAIPTVFTTANDITTVQKTVAATENIITTGSYVVTANDEEITAQETMATTESIAITGPQVTLQKDVTVVQESEKPTDTVITTQFSLTTTKHDGTIAQKTTAATENIVNAPSIVITADDETTTQDSVESTENTVTAANDETTAQGIIETTENFITTGPHVTKAGDETKSQGSIETTENIVTTDPYVTTADNDTAAQSALTTTAAADLSVTPVRYSREQCLCKCIRQTAEKKQQEEAAEIADQIKNNLTIPRGRVSATVRRYTSASDSRPSSMYIGMVMGIICFSPLVAIILCDCLVFFGATSRNIKSRLSGFCP